MEINVKTYGFDLDSEINHFALCCAAFELGPQRGRIESVLIHLTHAQEPPHSKDRHCLVEIVLSDDQRIFARDRDLDLHVAVYRALEHAGSMCTQRYSHEDLHAGQPPVSQPLAPETGEANRAA